ncbi:MAG: energy-coupling factor transporter ATPase [Lachnospiraceae bacterium]|nr:energy-coupling factor transporter ATPase [Lachnospiraceae bacterium]
MQIELKNVNFIYNKDSAEQVEALSDINLTFGGDSFIAIIGSTGSGKSTLIQLLNALQKPTEGTILWDGEDIYALQDSKKRIRLLRCSVGMAFQYPEHQFFETEVLKDVSFGPKNQGHTKEESEELAKKALAAVGLGPEYYEKSPFELSGGELRRAGIAGILAMEPEILILDEPTAGLDPQGKTDILDELKSIQQSRHITVILVSHSMEEVASYADRVIVLSGGHVIMDGSTHEVFSRYKELEEVGLKAPEVTYFMEELAQAGIPVNANAITIDEALKQIIPLI